MEFLLLFLAPAGRLTPNPECMERMGRFAATLAEQRKLKCGAPLATDAAGARIRKRGGETLLVDGPFAESKEVVAGFWIVEVADRAEAIDVASRCPHAADDVAEVHPIEVRYQYPDHERGTPYLLAFATEPGFCDADGDMRREMLSHAESLAREGRLFETTPLAHDPPPARVRRRGGKMLVTDGPFAEAKEVVGGYSLVRAADGAEALALATAYPHAQWGTVEVREILFFDRT